MITKVDLILKLREIRRVVLEVSETRAKLLDNLVAEIQAVGVERILPEECQCQCCQRHKAEEIKRAKVAAEMEAANRRGWSGLKETT